MPKVKLFNEQEVLQKAMVLFWTKGYHHTSISDLVAFLGISRSSLYDTFGGKRNLFMTAFQLYRSANQAGLQNFLQTQHDTRQTLRMMFEKIIHDDHIDDNCKGCFIVNTTTELVPDDEELQAIITKHKEEMEQVFFNILQAGVQSGQIKAEVDLKTVARLLYTLMTGLRVLGKTRPNEEESMASVNAVLSLLD